MIANGNVVNGSIINTHVLSINFLRNQNNRYDSRTKTFSYIPVVQKLLDLSLNFLSLFQIDPICSTVWQRRFRDQVNFFLSISMMTLPGVSR
jgi:hypothetical protein